MPSVFNEEDAEQIIRHVLKNSSNSLFKDSLTIGPSAVTSQSFVNNLKPIFDPLIAKKAQDVVTSGAYLQAQADQRSAKMKGQTGSNFLKLIFFKIIEINLILQFFFHLQNIFETSQIKIF